jgi:hypothetical protein
LKHDVADFGAPQKSGARNQTVGAQSQDRLRRPSSRARRPVGAIQNFSDLVIKVTKQIGLEPKGQHRKQQMPRQVRRGRPLENPLPAGAQPLQSEIAQVNDP